MAEDEEHGTGRLVDSSGRSLSPYHKKCFPPYCDSSPLVDKQLISKMDRDELEDKFIVYADENLMLKRQIRDQERQVQRLQTTLARKDKLDRRAGSKTPALAQHDCDQIDYLQSQNTNLKAKVKVLKQQLLNHSYIHSKENKIAEMRDKARKRESLSPEALFREASQIHSAREKKSHLSPNRSHQGKSAGEVGNLKERVAVLEQLLEAQKDKYKARIAQLEKSLEDLRKGDKDELSQHSSKVNVNVEMIKLQRLNQEQADKLASLKAEHETALREIGELKEALEHSTKKAEDLQTQLEREREKSREALGHVTKSASHTETIRALEEQIRDLQNEKKTLKETNEQLLQLTIGPQAKSEKSLSESRLKHQISSLERSLQEKLMELEEKEEQLIMMRSLLDEAKTGMPQPSETNIPVKSPVSSCILRQKEELQNQLEAVIKQAQEEKEELQAKLCAAYEEIECLRKALEETKTDSHLKVENEDLERRLGEALKELQQLKSIASAHKLCPQNHLQNAELEEKLCCALREIENLKGQLEQQAQITSASSKSLVKKTCVLEEDPDLKESLCEALLENQELRMELEKLKDGNQERNNKHLEQKLDEALAELHALRPIASQHNSVCKRENDEKFKMQQEINDLKRELEKKGKASSPPAQSSSKKSLERTFAIDVESDLRSQLCDALMENQQLRMQLEDAEKGDLTKEECQKKLYEAERALEMLRPLAAEHENCWLLKEENRELQGKLNKANQDIEYLNRELGERQMVVKKSATSKSPSRVCSGKALKKSSGKVSEKSSGRIPCGASSSGRLSPKRSERLDDTDSDMESGDLKGKLCNALMENQKLRKQIEGLDVNEKDTYLKKENTELERKLCEALQELKNLRGVAEEHRYCPKHGVSEQRVTSAVPSQRSTTPIRCATSGSKKSPSPSPQPSIHGSHKSPHRTPQPSSHRLEHHQNESRKQPVMVIVSKHEFESVLMEKRKIYTESESLTPSRGTEINNCRMDICVYDLEVDNHLLDQLTNLERDPYIYVVWSFLGLEQRTVAMPASQAQFCTSVTYYGPVSDPMAAHVRERELRITVMLERSNGRETLVGEGRVNLMPALEQPSRSFVRCVTLCSDLGGTANMYVSFRLYECCSGGELSPTEECLEVGIGRLQLDNQRVPNPDATHLYVEYSLLGHCGPELETDSVPRNDTMRFNHTKRLRVSDDNASRLRPLLKPGDTESLKFNVIAEPCDLSEATEVQPIGHAEVNLLQEMVYKDQDIISKQVPVYGNDGNLMGKLSVTIIGISTLQNHTPR